MKGVRFAPSPTGAFHIGNLRTAWISRWWALHLKEPWVVRFEDIDSLRSAPGAQELQLSQMALLGLTPDEVFVQSASLERHWQVFERAVREGKVYPCFCSRKEVKDALEGAASAPHGSPPIYSGRCRSLEDYPEQVPAMIAWRFRNADPAHDFIVARAAAPPGKAELASLRSSFAPAYHWACAIDDYIGAYRMLVRASDLASVLNYQRAVGEMLFEWSGKSVEHPAVFHCSLVTREDGGRLEKRTPGASLQEVMAGGLSADDVVRILESSFDIEFFSEAPNGSVSSGLVFGEKLDTLSLSALGFYRGES